MVIPEMPELPKIKPYTIKPVILNNYEKYYNLLPLTTFLPAIPSLICITCVLIVILVAYNVS